MTDPNTVLVVGGAGYVGSHVTRELLTSGFAPAIFDDLSSGHADVARRLNVTLIHGDVRDRRSVAVALKTTGAVAVVHLAGRVHPGDSVRDPLAYYEANVGGTLALLRAMRDVGCRRIVFSSTCAVYGPSADPMDEATPRAPLSPYGASKLAAENAIMDTARAHGWSCVCLRYFNAAGASTDALLGEQRADEWHLIPVCLQVAAGGRTQLDVFGGDHPTPDGTCVRDYVHVEDLARGHVLALAAMERSDIREAVNLGTGAGCSVLQVVRCCEQVTGESIPHHIVAPRPGDPSFLVAVATRARELLSWEPRHTSLDAMVASAWRWQQRGEPYRAP